MEAGMKVEIINKETIKPSSPTPHHLRNFKLSFLDQISPALYTPLVLFYPSNGDKKSMEIRSECLKKSLSKTLTDFYPIAGRINDGVTVDCNDDGVDYSGARVNCSLSDILIQPEAKLMNQFLPIDVVAKAKEAGKGPLLLVQVNLFECGGIAIGVNISHKIGDAATLSTFMKCWAAMASESTSEVVHPKFQSALLFPPLDFSIPAPEMKFPTSICVTTRLVFNASRIDALQSATSSTNVPHPTRVEAVSALIWKCAMKASRWNSGFSRPSAFTHITNMRKRLDPPLPENSFGNLIGCFASHTAQSETELKFLVAQLREGLENYGDNFIRKLGGIQSVPMILESAKEAGNLLTREDIDSYFCSSWCKFQLYEVNFGWGKPERVSVADAMIKNTIVLMDTKDGEGIEAWVTLTEQDMALFEQDQELLAFASLDPSV